MRLLLRGWPGVPSWHRYYAVPAAKRYHRAECDLGRHGVLVTHAEAQAQRLTPCRLCKPPPCW